MFRKYTVLELRYLGYASVAFILVLVGAGLCQVTPFVSTASQNVITLTLAVIFLCVGVSACFPEVLHGRREVDIFAPPLMVVVFALVYVLFPAVYLALAEDYYSYYLPGRQAQTVQIALLVGVVGIYFFGFGYHLKNYSRFRMGEKNSSTLQNNKAVRFLLNWAFPLILMGLIFKIIHLVSIESSFAGLVAQLSPSARREEGHEISQAVLMLGSMADWGVLLLVFRYLLLPTNRRTNTQAVLLMLLVCAFAGATYLITGKRSFIFPFFILPFVWYHYVVRPISIRSGVFMFLGVFVLLIGLLFVRIVGPLYVQSLSPADFIGENSSDVMAFYLQTGEFSPFDMIMGAIVDRERLLLMSGGIAEGIFKYNFGTIIFFVPRAIWPTKPLYEDLSHVFSYWATGAAESVGIAPTVFGAFYLFGHFAGLAVGMVVVGLVFRGVYEKLISRRRSVFDVFLYGIFIWLAFQYLRFGMLGFLFLLFIQTQLIGVVIALLGRERTLRYRET